MHYTILWLVDCAAPGKAKDISKDYPNLIVIGAGTFVIHDEEKLGKPKPHLTAQEYLGFIKEIISDNNSILGLPLFKILSELYEIDPSLIESEILLR